MQPAGVLRVGIVVVLLSLAALACNLPGGATPTLPASPIPVSTEAAGELEDLWKNAIESAQDGQVSVTMTEEQLTSFVALRLADDPDPMFEDVQIFLRDGQIQAYGTANIRGIRAPGQLSFDVTTGDDGRLQVEIVEADFGPLPIPQSMLDTVANGLNELITGELGPQATGFQITDVTIADGTMVVTGTVTR
jgi:uncharacterized protein YpmS